MTQTSHLKSPAITNLDATPIVANTTGEGSPGYSRTVSGYVTTVSADAAGSTYQLVRVPTNAKVKSVLFESAAMSAGKISLSVYYSDSSTDGTAPANQGLIVGGSPGGVGFFAVDIDCSSAVAITEEVNQSGTNPINLRDEPLWQALGLATEPTGFFDIVGVCHTTAITTGALMGIRVTFVD